MNDKLKSDHPEVSIITVVYNNVRHVHNAIESVLSQNYPNIEFIVIDGGSTDGTVGVINNYADKISIFISERDGGIYDALNKGIRHATGEVIAILHSDDLFYNNQVVSDTIMKMKDTGAEFCFSDMVIVDNETGKIIRYYKASYFKRWMFRIGWMSPHPTTFIKKALFNEFALYSTDYKIAGDFDFFVRIFYKRMIRWTYLDRVTVKMQTGGASNAGLSSKKIIAMEISRSLQVNKVWSLPVFQLGRYLIRAAETLMRPSSIKSNY